MEKPSIPFVYFCSKVFISHSTASLHLVHQRRQPLNPHFQLVAALNRADAAGRAGEDHVAGQQRQVRRDETDEFGGLKMSCFVFEFWRNWPFWKSWMLKSCGSIFVSTNGPSGVKVSNDLQRAHCALGLLNRAVADVLRGGVTENVARAAVGGDVADVAGR